MSGIESAQGGPFFVVTEQVTRQRIVPESQIDFPVPKVGELEVIELSRRSFTGPELANVVYSLQEDIEFYDEHTLKSPDEVAKKSKREAMYAAVSGIGFMSAIITSAGVYLELTPQYDADRALGIVCIGGGGLALRFAVRLGRRWGEKDAIRTRKETEVELQRRLDTKNLHQAAVAQLEKFVSTSD